MGRCATSSSRPRTTSRWRPTPEQLMVLQELFMGRGVKTPTAQMIQRITQQLRQFGEVETKNVFYWFQNHKAREKQKLRKSATLLLNYHHHQQPNFVYCLPSVPPPLLSQSNSCEFWPVIPVAQMVRGNNQVLEMPATDSSEHWNGSSTYQKPRNVNVSTDHHRDNEEKKDRSSGRAITWMNVDMMMVDSASRRRPPLKTLQLFPTSS